MSSMLDAFINIGWGTKSTQFHGSLGKAAAQSSTSPSTSDIPKSLSHPTDDGLPQITFRGDAAFFAISSLDPYSTSTEHTRRQIRIYSRDGPRLSATSESLPGLEASIAWRPSGSLLSALVRYGYDGGGEGREGRWDVAMLERNGLRHGGFELREKKGVWKSGKVRGMGWNADSELLAIWIERHDEDISGYYVVICVSQLMHFGSPTLVDEELPLLSEARAVLPFTFIRWQALPGVSLAYGATIDNIRHRRK